MMCSPEMATVRYGHVEDWTSNLKLSSAMVPSLKCHELSTEDCESPSNILLQTAHHHQREKKYFWPSGRGKYPFFAVSEHNAPFHLNDSLAWLGNQVQLIKIGWDVPKICGDQA